MEQTRSFKRSGELKKMSKHQLSGKWGAVVLLVFIFWIISMTSAIPYVGAFVHLIIGGALLLGLKSCFVKVAREEKFELENLFSGFKNLGSSILVQLLIGIFIFLWGLLAIIPFVILVVASIKNDGGIGTVVGAVTVIACIILSIPAVIAGYRYSMAYYILNDHPDVGSYEAIVQSKQMMKGYKWKLFCLHLSFIGWFILGIISIGIGFLWIAPYYQTANANFYEELKNVQEYNEQLE